ncbi:agmatine deiminase family protein [Gryllotalpicola protaetiae]|uniref:Agmatine deiminase family protein n=1 Tax=Gryllotalpicola protaetiae TaxID=2419771 RepID=A0A387BMU7_9MICO|nr:agmatine deiminase family protein [Gryllotalpicola protaetiae]AYG02519.1 agmatine deiminase family protein [Gryllotalpicola protaetiae]
MTVWPAETAPQERLWLAFPTGGYTLGETAADAHEARRMWADVAAAAADFEPVTVVVDPSQIAVATRYLRDDIETVVTPLDDAWMRDIGPTWVHDETAEGSGRSLRAVDWVFNGWGAPAWATWGNDSLVAQTVAATAGTPVVSSLLVNEGGAIHGDGDGTVLVTETVQLDAGRNPYATKQRVEAELARTLGARKAIWLPRGLTRDYEEFGTRGHVDMVATIPSPGTLLLHTQQDPAHPDFEVTRMLRDFFEGQTDASGRRFDIVELPAPGVLSDDEGPVDYNYVNHVVVNGGVIACAFGDPEADDRAAGILADAYPGRRVVSLDARPLFARGGGIHCITQQQPAQR